MNRRILKIFSIWFALMIISILSFVLASCVSDNNQTLEKININIH